MIERRLKTAILLYLWAALFEDTVLFLISWFAPELWFRIFHHALPTTPFEVAFLRRSGGQWAAFAVAQAITLWRWRRNPEWLAVAAGIRFSDLFTDICYILAVPMLTGAGWFLLTPPAFLNLLGVIILLKGYTQARRSVSSAT